MSFASVFGGINYNTKSVPELFWQSKTDVLAEDVSKREEAKPRPLPMLHLFVCPHGYARTYFLFFFSVTQAGTLLKMAFSFAASNFGVRS